LSSKAHTNFINNRIRGKYLVNSASMNSVSLRIDDMLISSPGPKEQRIIWACLYYNGPLKTNLADMLIAGKETAFLTI
jgi:hypothetical protein